MFRFLVVLPLAGLLSGCGVDVHLHSGEEASPPTADDINRKVAAGESCGVLFQMRNQLDPHSPDIPRINARFREIGCYMNSSTRTK